MSGSIRLHKEHGLNPTILGCYLCGGEKNELALLGNSYKEKAPMHMIIDKNPCDKCKKMMSMGIMIIEMKKGMTDPDVMQSRTGRLFVIKEEAAKHIFNDDRAINARACFMSEDTVNILGLGEIPPTHEIENGEVKEIKPEERNDKK